ARDAVVLRGQPVPAGQLGRAAGAGADVAGARRAEAGGGGHRAGHRAVHRHQVAAGRVGAAGVPVALVGQVRLVGGVEVGRGGGEVGEGGVHHDHRTGRIGDIGLGDRVVAVGRGVGLLPGQRGAGGVGEGDRVRGVAGLAVGEAGAVGDVVLQTVGVRLVG